MSLLRGSHVAQALEDDQHPLWIMTVLALAAESSSQRETGLEVMTVDTFRFSLRSCDMRLRIDEAVICPMSLPFSSTGTDLTL